MYKLMIHLLYASYKAIIKEIIIKLVTYVAVMGSSFFNCFACFTKSLVFLFI